MLAQHRTHCILLHLLARYPEAVLFGWPLATENGLLFASQVCQPTLYQKDTHAP
jgi:hypothetical protein